MFFLIDLPNLRKLEKDNESVVCRVSLIKWVANYMHSTKRGGDCGPLSIPSTYNAAPFHTASHDDDDHSESHVSLDSSKYFYSHSKESYIYNASLYVDSNLSVTVLIKKTQIEIMIMNNVLL